METFCVGDLLLWLDVQQFAAVEAEPAVVRSYADDIVRKYLSEEAEIPAVLPPALQTELLAAVQSGPWGRDLFAAAQGHLHGHLAAAVLPGFFRSPAGLMYSRNVMSKEHSRERGALANAVVPNSASIVGFEKQYEATEKYYQYKIEVMAETSSFAVWRRYSEFHHYYTQLKLMFNTMPSVDVGQFPRKLCEDRRTHPFPALPRPSTRAPLPVHVRCQPPFLAAKPSCCGKKGSP